MIPDVLILYVTSNCFHFIDILSFHSNNYEYHLNMWVTVSLTELCTCILNSYFVLVNVHHLAMCKRIGGMTTTWLCTGHFHLKTTLYWQVRRWRVHSGFSNRMVLGSLWPSCGHFSNSITFVPLLVALNGNQQFFGFIYIYIYMYIIQCLCLW